MGPLIVLPVIATAAPTAAYTAANFVMTNMPKIIELAGWGAWGISQTPGVIDCVKSAENGFEGNVNAGTPVKACYIAGEIGSGITSLASGILGASPAQAAQPMVPPSVPMAKNNEPQVPIAR